MPRIPVVVEIPHEVVNGKWIEKKYSISIQTEPSSFRKMYYDFEEKILAKVKEQIPEGWGAEISGLSGLEVNCHKYGVKKSISIIGLDGLHKRVEYYVPVKYHFVVTDEFTGIKEVEVMEEKLDYVDNKFYEGIKPPKINYIY